MATSEDEKLKPGTRIGATKVLKIIPFATPEDEELKKFEKEFEIPDDDEEILMLEDGNEKEDKEEELITSAGLVKELVIKLIIIVVGMTAALGILAGILALLSKNPK